MQAIILAGGLGTRLKSIVSNKPKALSTVADYPFLYYVINFLHKQGVQHFIFSLGYLNEQIIAFLQDNYKHLSYTFTVEDSPLGTGGGLRKAIQLATQDDVLVVNADSFFEINISLMMQKHQLEKCNCTIALKPMTNFERYGSVVIDNDNNITSFREKCYTEKGYINGGYLVVDKNFYINATSQLPAIFSYEKDFLEPNLNNMKIKGFISNDFFIDIGIPEDYKRAQEIFKKYQ